MMNNASISNQAREATPEAGRNQAGAEEPAAWRKRTRKFVKRRAKKFVLSVGNYMARQGTVPDQAIFDPREFPWAADLESNFDVVRAELAGVLKCRDALPSLHEIQREQYRISADEKWKAFVLCGWGFQAEEGARLCPQTYRLVARVPGLRTAFFSILEPGAHIPEHRSILRGLLRGQLAMIVPKQREKCVLHVDGTPHCWTEGRMLVFDDTYLHEVHNDTDEERVVLILHFDRPMNWRGRLVNRTLTALIRRSPFVKDARRNYAQWARRFNQRRIED
jgi:beta-hydroxylase